MEKFNLYNLLVDKDDVNDCEETIMCDTCNDIFRNPILCPVGHSVCDRCIELSFNKNCRTCFQSIDYKIAKKNLVSTSFIAKLVFHCPYHKILGTHDNCNFRGLLGQLEEHLTICTAVPLGCCFPLCKFVGKVTSIKRNYYDNNQGKHLTLLEENKKLSFLVEENKKLRATISVLENTLINENYVKNILKVNLLND